MSQLLLPLIQTLFSLAIQIGSRLAPEFIADATALISTALQILESYATMQMSSQEAKDSFTILVETLKTQGDTLLGKLQVEAERLPSELLGGFNTLLGSLPGELLKLV